jgi:hypothetical protein
VINDPAAGDLSHEHVAVAMEITVSAHVPAVIVMADNHFTMIATVPRAHISPFTGKGGRGAAEQQGGGNDGSADSHGFLLALGEHPNL